MSLGFDLEVAGTVETAAAKIARLTEEQAALGRLFLLYHDQLTPGSKEFDPDLITAIPEFSSKATKTVSDMFMPTMKLVQSDSEEARTFNTWKDSVGYLIRPDGSVKGTTFALDHGWFGTSGHVGWNPADDYFLKLEGRDPLSAKLIARDQVADVALLKVDGMTDSPRPFQLMPTSSLQNNARTFIIGRPGGVLVMSEGITSRLSQTDAALGASIYLRKNQSSSIANLLYTNRGRPGMSGAPVIIDQRLAGVHSGLGPDPGFAQGVSSDHLGVMMERAEKNGFATPVNTSSIDLLGRMLGQAATKRPFVWLNLRTRAEFTRQGDAPYFEGVTVEREEGHGGRQLHFDVYDDRGKPLFGDPTEMTKPRF